MQHQLDLFAASRQQRQSIYQNCPSRRLLPNGSGKTSIIRGILPVFLCMVSFASVAAQDSDDTRRILEQNIERQAADRERELLKDEVSAPPGQRPTLTINGQTYKVERTASALGQALYLSLQYHQWAAAKQFLAEYLTLPDRDPLLVHYAQGTLARMQGQMGQALAEFRALLELQPSFLPGRLELARVLFEDAQERESEEIFSAILLSIDASEPKTAGVRKTIETYRNALKQRRAWMGSFSFGPSWSDNVNRTSASRTCLLYDSNGFCHYERILPEAIRASGMDFDASLQKRIPLFRHHGLYMRSLFYGTQYRNHGDNNETTFTTQAGYSYRDDRQQIAFAPSFEYYEWGNDALYGSWGLNGEWSYELSPISLVKLEGEYKELRYRREGYARNINGTQSSVYATYFRDLGKGWAVFGGIDFVDSKAKEDINAYQQKGVRIGALVQVSGFHGTLFAAYKHRDYDVYNPLVEAYRKDDEQTYTLVLKAPRWQLAGFIPSLTLRHNRVKSSVDWLYSYDRNDISLKFEYIF
ncbi:surface lipoprotein assembly modifier [Shewanella algae]|uniref:surface lipoprotein assembly modifier n=1 Tax=Shewanella algae TaxID=38313 RepID=UPI00313A9F09